MISLGRLNSQGANKNGDLVVDYMFKTDYYINAQGQKEDAIRWGGKLALDPDLNLAGKAVLEEDMLQLASGFSPDGKPLCRNAGAKGKEVVKLDRNGNPRLDKQGRPITKLEGGHRVGYDATFTPPKPFSVAFAIAEGEERDAILNAHRQAVAAGMRRFEEVMETRRGSGGKEVMAVQGLIYMQADHMASRNLDMNIHTHNLIFGVAKGEDGQWGTFDTMELYRYRKAVDTVYKNEFAANMRALGYSIETERLVNDDGKETGQVAYRIAGISDELCETFSSRRQQILDYQREHGVDAQTACLATRRHKDEPSYAELTSMWKQTMAAMDEGAVPTIEQLKRQTDKYMEAKSDAEILEQLHQGEAVFCDHDLIHVLGQEYAGKLRYEELLTKIDDFKKTTGLVAVEAARLADDDKGLSLARRHSETRYAAPWMVEWEKEVVHRVESRKNEEHQKVPVEVVGQAIENYEARKGFKLSAEQRASVMNLTAETGGVGILEGFAGTGKTTVSDCYSEAFKAQGRRMLGVAVSNAAAQKLEDESGMPCVSVSKMIGRLERGRMQFTSKDVLVVDEAGMIETNQVRQLLAHAQKGGAKVVIQGDTAQLQPIGAGSGLSLAKMGEKSTKLTEMWRQADVEDRETAGMWYPRDEDGKHVDLKKGARSRRETIEMGGKILARLHARKAIDAYDTQPQAMAALVSDYLANPKSADEKLVIAHEHAEVRALNEAIRQGLKDRGEIDARDTKVRVKNHRGFWDEINLARGDRVRFTDGNNELGIINGSKGNVLRVEENKRTGGVDITVRLESSRKQDDGRLVRFNSKDVPHLTNNFAATVHAVQGQGKEEVFHLANPGMMDSHSTLVGFTRLTKGKYRLYGTTDDIEQLGDRFGMERLKETALDAGLKKTEAKSMLTTQDRADLEQAAAAFLKGQLERRREAKREQGHGQEL